MRLEIDLRSLLTQPQSGPCNVRDNYPGNWVHALPITAAGLYYVTVPNTFVSAIVITEHRCVEAKAIHSYMYAKCQVKLLFRRSIEGMFKTVVIATCQIDLEKC